MRPPMQFGASARCAVVLPFGEKKTGRCLRYCFVFGDNLGMALSGGFFRFTTGLKVCNVRKVRQTGAPMYFTRPFKLPKPQRLHQKQDRDCGVSVFAALAGVSEEELLAEVPGADRGTVTVNGWCAWLERKGFTVTKRKGCPAKFFRVPISSQNVLQEADDPHWVLGMRTGTCMTRRRWRCICLRMSFERFQRLLAVVEQKCFVEVQHIVKLITETWVVR